MFVFCTTVQNLRYPLDVAGEVTEELELKEDEIAVRVTMFHSKPFHFIAAATALEGENTKSILDITPLSMQCATVDTLLSG